MQALPAMEFAFLMSMSAKGAKKFKFSQVEFFFLVVFF